MRQEIKIRLIIVIFNLLDMLSPIKIYSFLFKISIVNIVYKITNRKTFLFSKIYGRMRVVMQMIREEYVDQSGVEVNQKERDKKTIMRGLFFLGVLIFIIILYFLFKNLIEKNYCHKMIDKISSVALSYTKDQNILPKSEGDYIMLSLDTLIDKKQITEKDITVNKKIARGTIKITKYKKEYIVTVELKDCDYCDSSKRKWSKELSKKPDKKILDVIAYYNYYNKTNNYTDWTSWYTNEQLAPDISKEYNIRLPKQKSMLPKIASDAKIISIDQETQEYYRYRDKKWKYYRGGGNYTSYFSSIQPSGYSSYDPATLKYTEWSAYSLNYPEKKTYREIQKTTGFKWYVEKNGKKIYYKNGNYFVSTDVPDTYIKDSKQSSPMYRYRDKSWRWYVGEKRTYSSYSSSMPRGFTNRDDELYTFGAYSNWSDTSSLNANNSAYRVEESDTRYRYRIHYNVYSFAIFEKPVTKEEFEKKLQLPLADLLKREDMKIDITYKFRYKN